jgi:transposase
MSSVKDPRAIHLALDVHKNTISVGVLERDSNVPAVERISSDEDSVRRLIARFEDPRQLRACYEAGPTGYELARLLWSSGVSCEVIAPSLIPTARGDRVKTDARDCRRLALLHRAEQLVAIRVTSVAEESVRDVCRARADMIIDQNRARHRLGKFLLRHGRVWSGGDNWTLKHQAWLTAQRFDDAALTATYSHYRATLLDRENAVRAIDTDLAQWFTRPPFADPVARLAAYRGITALGALTLASEVCDWRRFATGEFMGFAAWCPVNTPVASGPAADTSPMPATCICAPQLVESAWA